jgi:hypothetical protein
VLWLATSANSAHVRLLTIELAEDRAGLPSIDERVQRILLDAGHSAQDR